MEAFRELTKVFGDDSYAMLRLATAGAGPAEIAQKLEIPEATAKRFIEAFVALPEGYDRMILRAPSVLSKGPEMRSMIRAALKSRSR